MPVRHNNKESSLYLPRFNLNPGEADQEVQVVRIIDLCPNAGRHEQKLFAGVEVFVFYGLSDRHINVQF